MLKVSSQKLWKRAFALASLGLSLTLLLAVSLALPNSSSLPISALKNEKKNLSHEDIKNIKSSYFQFMKKVYATQEINKACGQVVYTQRDFCNRVLRKEKLGKRLLPSKKDKRAYLHFLKESLSMASASVDKDLNLTAVLSIGNSKMRLVRSGKEWSLDFKAFQNQTT